MKTEKVCFVIMPISDAVGYDPGHFTRVYEHIIKPACIAAGFTPIRADDVKKTNVIVIDILQKLVSSEMAICDLSSQNPNVMYELGIRQAFDLPVTFLKDDLTERIFDIQGYRDVLYNSTLRIDEVKLGVELLTAALIETAEVKPEENNSIVGLLGITKAKISKSIEISRDTDLILRSIQDLSSRLNLVEQGSPSRDRDIIQKIQEVEVNSFKRDGEEFSLGETITHPRFGHGKIIRISTAGGSNSKITVMFPDSGVKQLLSNLAPISKFQKS